ncbi:MAG: 2,3-bisphosphoglycerate-independent phosphoglycerate mutase [Candidatus Colwellbacteria bacterium]|nr:2,3-bisphosphoglycerate-independent phosphoglycerate mutase [Candidatus Colwellbacteria bacterium]
MAKRTVVLLVLSGWGIGKKDSSNPIYKAEPKNLNYIRLNYPAGTLQASGIAVGLPWNEEGNPEVGYLTMGAGKVLYQNYPRISLAIQDESFFKNEELLRVIKDARDRGGKVNLLGLIGEGTSVSALEHLEALIKMAKDEGVPFALHLFGDGRDSANGSTARLIAHLPQDRIGSISGRHYAMDIDLHLEKTLMAYEAMVGSKAPIEGVEDKGEFVKKLYSSGVTDEFIVPTLFDKDLAVKDGDGVIFFNFGEDSQRQLSRMFIDPAYGGKPHYELGERDVKKHIVPENLSLLSLVEYEKTLGIKAAFPQEGIVNPIGKVLSDAGKIQLRIAETQKYAYVTTLFNGMVNQAFPDEYRVVIPSREEAKVDEHPEMRVGEIAGRVLSALNEGIYDFILADFSNADMVAHTGNFDATIKAIKAIDDQVGLIVKATLDSGSILIITSDHGNAEIMMDLKTGARDLGDNKSPVPIYIVTRGYERRKDEAQAEEIEKLNAGVLSDVAPTILELMGVPKSEDMTGISLLQLLR